MSYLQSFGREEEVAYAKGYRVSDDGRLLNPQGAEISGYTSSKRHLRFRHSKGGPLLFVHRLAAFQKFGAAIYAPGQCVRHIDGNPTNNRPDNLAIGTHSDNMMDKPSELRRRCATQASRHIIKHNHLRVLELHRQGLTHAAIMRETGISSLGTVSYIVRKSLARQEVAA